MALAGWSSTLWLQRAATIQKVSGRQHSEMSANGDTLANSSKDKGNDETDLH